MRVAKSSPECHSPAGFSALLGRKRFHLGPPDWIWPSGTGFGHPDLDLADAQGPTWLKEHTTSLHCFEQSFIDTVIQDRCNLTR